MSSVENIAKVAVVGAGLTAWSAAAALKRRIPSLDIRLVPAPASEHAVADQLISTLPSIHGFHQDISLTDVDTIGGARSGARLGTSFEGWAYGVPDYVHSYGAYGRPFGGIPFHQLWLRDRHEASLPSFDHFSPASELARSGEVTGPAADGIEFGLQLTLGRYGEMMLAYAQHLGVISSSGALADVQIRSTDGFIDELLLDDGTALQIDLCIDCTGPAALVHSRLASKFIDWNRWLPCDRMIIGVGAPDATLVSLDCVRAGPSFWRWDASSPEQSSRGIVYCSSYARDDELEPEIGKSATHDVTLRQGRREDFWTRNCVAVGDAAVAIEPLEWTNLHLVHSQLDRIVSMMPARDCAPVEIQEFNRQCAAEADRVRDFVCLHYRCARRSEPFWTEAADAPAPPSLAHTLAQFAQRGRLPYYEEETFAKDSWLAVMLGQGFEPRNIDPMADLVPRAEAAHMFRTARQSLASFSLPSAGASLPDLNPRGVR